MKTKFSKSNLSFLMMIFTLLFLGCGKDDTTTSAPPPPPPDCSGTEKFDNYNLNYTETRAGTGYTGQAVATFKFSQSYKTYNSACNLQDLYGGLSLTISNNTTKNITIAYSIVAFSLANIITIQYQNSTNIPANSSVSLANIYNGPVKFTSQRVTVNVTTLNYL